MRFFPVQPLYLAQEAVSDPALARAHPLDGGEGGGGGVRAGGA